MVGIQAVLVWQAAHTSLVNGCVADLTVRALAPSWHPAALQLALV